MEERPLKRARNNSPPISITQSTSTTNTTTTSTKLQLSNNSLPIYEPNYYNKPTTFQQPLHLTSFSFDSNREVLLNQSNQNDSINYYKQPKIGIDLNQGFNECIWREDNTDEGLDSLLDSLNNYAKDDKNAAEILSKTHVITWRGMMSKLLLAVYEAEGVSRGNRSEGWEMNAMVIDGVLYLEESKSPSIILSKKDKENSFKSQSYMGYSFESYCTTSASSSLSSSVPSSISAQESESFSVPNTNVQWCSVVKTNLGGFRILIGGEVDCLASGSEHSLAEGGVIETSSFIELKTNIAISSQRDEINFERQKLLKHYIQSFLLGVPLVVVGFRTRAGTLTALESFKTLEIPRLVRGKPHAWDPIACLTSGKTILAFLHQEISNHPRTIEYQSHFSKVSSPSPTKTTSTSNSTTTILQELSNWPVFRIKFDPKSNNHSSSNSRNNNGNTTATASISIRELSGDEIVEEVVAGKKVEHRVGFVLTRWLEGVRTRREGKETDG